MAKTSKPDYNITIAKYYAAATCGTIAIFLIIHWIRIIYRKWGPAPGAKSSLRPFVALARQTRRLFFSSVPLVPSAGHVFVFAIFFAIQIILTFVKLDCSSLKAWGKRTGWMTTNNFAFLVFLAMRNSPLGFLTGFTYDRVQILHRVAGYATVIFVIIHACTYSKDFVNRGERDTLLEKNMVMGIVAGLAMFLMSAIAVILRRRQYELFYYSHVCFFILSAIGLGMHRPKWRTAVPQASIFIVSIWFLDRLVRALRTLYLSINNSAMLLPVIDDDGEGTRIILKRKLPSARPGQHCFVWVPRVRLFETHPFTIVANGPNGLELVANSCAGFTRSLHQYASKNTTPQAPCTVWASVDGPYGIFPDVQTYDRIILVAGGSGATFTFGLATHLLENLHPESQQRLDFIWAVKRNDRLTWFSNHIDKLKSYDAHVEITIHVTKDTAPKSFASTNESSLHEKDCESSHSTPTTPDEERAQVDKEILQSNNSVPMFGIRNLHYEKLKVPQSITKIIDSVSDDHRVLIAACGPSPLMVAVREAAANCIKPYGPSIDLHYESFEW